MGLVHAVKRPPLATADRARSNLLLYRASSSDQVIPPGRRLP
ncbi:MAG: hypothetical protein AVDCRST_MAG27-3672 [uncultured Craurococcus sp.]|uniref:Uncharacterized protein n=1 Tax=uncultured Craurococcus sp. TaxID=1135998 RepID=A0A6J4JAB7_9PROT|nr:MAG: hypothetical protein AVDCRST_MAG27-3672 [uncultured Craurococcus sp.]